jgi:hypothetical protein
LSFVIVEIAVSAGKVTGHQPPPLAKTTVWPSLSNVSDTSSHHTTTEPSPLSSDPATTIRILNLSEIGAGAGFD